MPPRFQHGNQAARGKGRPKGSLNTYSRALAEALVEAARQSGDGQRRRGIVGYLEWLSKDRPELFCALLTRVLPNRNGEPPIPLDFPAPEELRQTLIGYSERG